MQAILKSGGRALRTLGSLEADCSTHFSSAHSIRLTLLLSSNRMMINRFRTQRHFGWRDVIGSKISK